MKKILQILIFTIVCSFSFAENFGSNLFNQETDVYFTSKEVNIYDLENTDLDELKQVLNEYKFFKGINIYDQIKNKEYSIVYEKTGSEKRFLVLISLDGKKVELPDNGFETEETNGMTIKYTIGEEQYIYAYDEHQLIFSNDMTLFFLTIEPSSQEKKTLDSKDKFKKLMSEDVDSVYKYYSEAEGLVDDKYISLAKAYYQLKSGGHIKKSYLLDGSEREYKNFDLTDYIPQLYKEVELGLKPEIVKNGINQTIPEFKLFDENKIDMYLEENMQFSANISTDDGGYTLVTLGNYKDTEDFIKQIFEEALFYNKKIDLIQGEGYKYFELPLLFRKIYFIEAGRFLLLTDKIDIVNRYLNGEIYNENFADTYNYDKVLVTGDKIEIKSNAENIMLEIEDFTK